LTATSASGTANGTGRASSLHFLKQSLYATVAFHIFFTHPMIVFRAVVSSNNRASRPPIHAIKGICDMIVTLGWSGIPQRRDMHAAEAGALD
jgi:hypothetical protein